MPSKNLIEPIEIRNDFWVNDFIKNIEEKPKYSYKYLSEHLGEVNCSMFDLRLLDSVKRDQVISQLVY